LLSCCFSPFIASPPLLLLISCCASFVIASQSLLRLLPCCVFSSCSASSVVSRRLSFRFAIAGEEQLMKRLIGTVFVLFYVWSSFTGRAFAQAEPPSGEAAAPEAAAHKLFEPKEGKDVTFYTPGGELTFYGYLDVSFDGTTKGIWDLKDSNGNGPVGHVGYMPALSTNLSYLGARGFVRLGEPLRFVWQLETQIDIAVSSGVSETSSNKSNTVRGGLTYRDTFLGFSTPWGSLKLGKTHTPYRNSTIRMNPFSGMIGDYAVVMGNTGGDNRVEFGTRLEDSIWYESPKIYGVSLTVLFSPGQNRGFGSDNIPSG